MILDDISRYTIAWKVYTTMRAEDITEKLERARTASGCGCARVAHRPRLLSDNGASYIADNLAEWLRDRVISHIRGAPFHAQTRPRSTASSISRRYRNLTPADVYSGRSVCIGTAAVRVCGRVSVKDDNCTELPHLQTDPSRSGYQRSYNVHAGNGRSVLTDHNYFAHSDYNSDWQSYLVWVRTEVDFVRLTTSRRIKSNNWLPRCRRTKIELGVSGPRQVSSRGT
jgi:hypothetical protein